MLVNELACGVGWKMGASEWVWRWRSASGSGDSAARVGWVRVDVDTESGTFGWERSGVRSGF